MRIYIYICMHVYVHVWACVNTHIYSPRWCDNPWSQFWIRSWCDLERFPQLLFRQCERMRRVGIELATLRL